MTKRPQYSHLHAENTRICWNDYQKAVCGVRAKNMFFAHVSEAAKMAEFIEAQVWMPKLCPKCAAVALITETMLVA